RNPRSVFAADLAGTNMITGRAVQVRHGPGVATADGHGPEGARGAGAEPAARRGILAAFRRSARGRAQVPQSDSVRPGPGTDSVGVAVETATGERVRGTTLHSLDDGESAAAVFAPRAVAVYRSVPD